MSNIENLLYSAHEHGQREALLKKVIEIQKTPEGQNLSQNDCYELAYRQIMKTG